MSPLLVSGASLAVASFVPAAWLCILAIRENNLVSTLVLYRVIFPLYLSTILGVCMVWAGYWGT